MTCGRGPSTCPRAPRGSAGGTTRTICCPSKSRCLGHSLIFVFCYLLLLLLLIFLLLLLRLPGIIIVILIDSCHVIIVVTIYYCYCCCYFIYFILFYHFYCDSNVNVNCYFQKRCLKTFCVYIRCRQSSHVCIRVYITHLVCHYAVPSSSVSWRRTSLRKCQIVC